MAGSVVDEEKGVDHENPKVPTDEALSTESPTESPAVQEAAPANFFTRLNEKVLSINYLEKRGYERVPVSERHEVNISQYVQMTLLWFSANITANNIVQLPQHGLPLYKTLIIP
jgi:hypothetical protein